MVRPPSRPPVGWLVAVAVLAQFTVLGVIAASVATALIVVVVMPSEPVWITLLVVMSLTCTAVSLRRFAPQWYAWLLGRLSQRPRSN